MLPPLILLTYWLIFRRLCALFSGGVLSNHTLSSSIIMLGAPSRGLAVSYCHRCLYEHRIYIDAQLHIAMYNSTLACRMGVPRVTCLYVCIFAYQHAYLTIWLAYSQTGHNVRNVSYTQCAYFIGVSAGHRPYILCDPDTDPDRPNRGGVCMLHLVWQPNDCNVTW